MRTISARAVAAGLRDPLAAAEQGLRRGLEREVVELDERVAREADAVEHDPARDLGAALAGERRVLRDRDRAGRAAELERDAERARARDQHVEVEVDHVPAGEDVGVELAHARGERAHERRLVRVNERALDRRGGEDVHLVGAGADQRHRQDAARVGQGLEVERQHAQLGVRAAGHELGIAEAQQRRDRRRRARPRSRPPRAGPCRRGSGTGSAGRPRARARRPRSACRAGAAPRAAPARRRARAARRRGRRARSARSRRRARRRAAGSPRGA